MWADRRSHTGSTTRRHVVADWGRGGRATLSDAVAHGCVYGCGYDVENGGRPRETPPPPFRNTLPPLDRKRIHAASPLKPLAGVLRPAQDVAEVVAVTRSQTRLACR